MTVLSGFSPVPGDPIGPDLAPRIAASIGKPVTRADVSSAPRDIQVEGPTLVSGDKAAIQTFLNGYTFDGSFGKSIQPYIFTLNGIPVATWTNQPAALTELPNSRVRLPLSGCAYARLTANVAVAGFAGATLLCRVSNDNGATWVSGPSVVIDSIGFKLSGLVAIPPAYQTDVLASVWGQGGNAVADPAFGLVTVQVA